MPDRVRVAAVLDQDGLRLVKTDPMEELGWTAIVRVTGGSAHPVVTVRGRRAEVGWPSKDRSVVSLTFLGEEPPAVEAGDLLEAA